MSVLAIGAHFDDIEYGCGGSIAKHIANDDNVTMLVITNSDYKNYNGETIRNKDMAKKEGELSAKILGANLICAGFSTKNVKFSVELIEFINKIIDEEKIDTIYTHWIYDVHQDHNAIARATLSAARHIPRILMYRSNWYSAKESFNGRFYVDISEFIDKKISAIKTHETEVKKRGQKWIDFIVHQNRNAGIEMETKYAEVFDIIRYIL